jgi:hypothetical protein
MRKKALQVLVAVSVLIFLMTSAMDTFAAKAAPSSQVKAVQTALNKDGYKVAACHWEGRCCHREKIRGKIGYQRGSRCR